MPVWKTIYPILMWPYWGDVGAGILFLFGLLLKSAYLRPCLFLVSQQYKKYAKLFFENIKWPLQWILILSSLLLVLYHGQIVQVHSAFLLNVFQTLLTFLIVWGIWRQTTNTKAWVILYSKEFNHTFHEIAVPLIRRGVRLLIVSVVLIIVSYIWGFDAQKLLTGMGILGIIVSFSAQDVIKNTFSGFILLFNKVFDLGDWVQVGKTSGTVESISLRFTKIKTVDHGIVTIPNSQIADSNLINWSKRDRMFAQLELKIDPNPSLSSLYKCIQHTCNKLMLNKHLCPESIQYKVTSTEPSITVSFSFDVRTTDFNQLESIKLGCYQDIICLFQHYQLISERNKTR